VVLHTGTGKYNTRRTKKEEKVNEECKLSFREVEVKVQAKQKVNRYRTLVRSK
jgi:hypothetical protein